MKKLLLFICASGIVLLSCLDLRASPAPKKVRIAVLMYGNKAEFVQLMQRYGKQHPAVTGGLAELTFYDGRYDAAVQNDQAQLAINLKYDAIIVNPLDFEANVDVVTKAKAAHIPVIVTNARLDTQEMTSAVDSDDVLGGYLGPRMSCRSSAARAMSSLSRVPKEGQARSNGGRATKRQFPNAPREP